MSLTLMKRLLFLILLLCPFASALHADPIDGLLGRILPHGNDASRFEWRVEPAREQQFAFSCDGRRICVTGSDFIAIATGINWYLQHYAGIDISWNAPTAKLPKKLQPCAEERHLASVPWRYYLNFCTHSYSMAFWDWNRWQQELDWMALHGVNMPLAIAGMECVWRTVLEAYGYTDVSSFVCGNAYFGWFFMNNLTAWGGPLPASWYNGREALAKKVFARMGEFGMQPVVPGYVGMVPKEFLAKASQRRVADWKPDEIVNGGRWNAFDRPAFVNNTDRLKEFGARYYAAFDSLFAGVCPTHFFAIDPFHEGGVPAGVTNAQASVAAMWEALLTYDPDAVWVAQHWQDNPTTILTHTIPHGRLIILDLHGDSNGDTVCSGVHTTADGTPHAWVWGQVSNFGGNVGLFGRMDRLLNCFYAARNNASRNALVGIGALPEGIENNAMLYDLLYALPWTSTDYTYTTWLQDYVSMRYGFPTNASANSYKAYECLLSAWSRLGEGLYNCLSNIQQGTTESVFLMRPSLRPGTVSTWAGSSWYWDFDEVRTALAEMLSVSKAMNHSQNYRYDLVDVTRQALADYGKVLLDSIREATDEARTAMAGRFLELILDQDRLLGTRTELRLGRWTEAARNLATTDDERTLYERNARMLLTTWGEHAQCERGQLHDYANREWNGLLAAYYYPRWRAFFDGGCVAQQWFNDFEWPFATGDTGAINHFLPDGTPYAYGTFSAQPEGDEISIAQKLYDKYFK